MFTLMAINVNVVPTFVGINMYVYTCVTYYFVKIMCNNINFSDQKLQTNIVEHINYRLVNIYTNIYIYYL